jgi:hypothetical protein
MAALRHDKTKIERLTLNTITRCRISPQPARLRRAL